MPVDNHLYDTLADSWWDESGFLHLLRALNPARFGYMRRVLLEELKLDPSGLRALEVGCGGGLLAEEFARLGCEVVGIDPSERSLAAARVHAEASGLAIDYRFGTGEAIPLPEGSFDLVYCCDVLEHVRDLPSVIAEIARVLRPGGVFFYDTLNRTWKSWLVMIQLFQECSWTSFLPPDLHDWRMFIRPAELLALLQRNGLANRGLTGLEPNASPLAILRALRARKKGEISYLEAARRLDLGESRDTRVVYIGYAIRASRIGEE
jgi:2-polyprenyl-6-hydroxyphenyl methylase/3-demethylubiquinone-9 3-methyltransferase